MTNPTRRNVLRGAAAVAAAGRTGRHGSGRGRPGLRRRRARRRRRHFPFLEGAFKPVTEELTAFDLPVTGRIPRELNGRYLRNGPNVAGPGGPARPPLDARRRHGARRAAARGPRRVVPQPLGALLAGGEEARRAVPGPGAAGRLSVQHPCDPLPGADPRAPGERPAAVRTRRRAEHRAARTTSGARCEGAFTAHTKFDAHADELHAIAYYPTWDHVRHLVVDPTGRVVAEHEDPGGGRADDPRLRAHREPRGDPRHAGHLRPGGCRARRHRAVRLERPASGAGRCAAAGGRRGPLVRGRPGLLLAHPQRVRGGRRTSSST